MAPRIHYAKDAPGVYQAMDALEKYLEGSPVDQKLLHLVRLRVSQLNACAYCIDMHWKDLIALGDQPQRLYGLDAWREAPYYTEAERAVLAYAEAVTAIAEEGVEDAVVAEVQQHFDGRGVADLTLTIATINAWNRLAIAARLPAGGYRSRLGG